MKTIPFAGGGLIRFERIKPFVKYCKVTGVKENVNIVVEYIPDGKVIDIVDYRKYFEREFNLLIEEICESVMEEIWQSAAPKYAKVVVYLEGNPHLTDWSVTLERKKA